MRRASTCAGPTTSPRSTTWTAARLVYLRTTAAARSARRRTATRSARGAPERLAKRLVIAVRAGRNAVIVKYSAGSDQSVVRYMRPVGGTGRYASSASTDS